MNTPDKPKPLWHYATLPATVVLVLTFVFGFDKAFGLELYRFGLWPMDTGQLYGILTFPFIHGSLKHLFNNAVGLLVLLSMIRYFFPSLFFRMLFISFFTPGILAFFIARPSYHIGASGAVYALAAFLFVSSILRSSRYLLALSLLVAFLYGGLWWGMLPIDDQMSWEGHLSGAIVGVIAAIAFIRTPTGADLQEPEEEPETEEDEGNDLIGDAWKMDDSPGIRYIYRDSHKDDQ